MNYGKPWRLKAKLSARSLREAKLMYVERELMMLLQFHGGKRRVSPRHNN